MPERRITLFISGKVQGVSYRANAAETARRLGVTGYARNLSDGRVEIVAEGPDEALIALEQWCRTGPPAAHVTDVRSEDHDATGEFNDFHIR